MAIDELTELLGAGTAGTPATWDEVEARLGKRLPADYKAFIDRYGTGSIGDFLWVLTPATENPFLNFFEKGNVMLDGYRQLRASWPREYPHTAYPEEGGLLPWAVSDNGDELYWLTEGDPDQWPTVIVSRGVPHEEYRMPMGDFLAGLITRRIESNAIAELGASFTPEE